jgi:predicted transposase YbfD/YdcC
VATEEKSNEITAIPTLLSLVDIRGAIITIRNQIRNQRARTDFGSYKKKPP